MDFTIHGRYFINLAKQTQRPEFVRKSEDSDYIRDFDNDSHRSEKKVKKYNRIQAPDFKKTITREKLNLIYDDKKGVIPFSMPKYTLVRESLFK